jgi:hypothetical protein
MIYVARNAVPLWPLEKAITKISVPEKQENLPIQVSMRFSRNSALAADSLAT